MKKFVNHTRAIVVVKAIDLRQELAEQRAEGYVDTAIKILIAVMLGALLPAGLYALFNDTVLPALVRGVRRMFGYAG